MVIDVEKAEHNLTARRGAYDPQLFSETYFERSSTPVASFLGGNDSGSLEQKDFTSKIGMTGRSPKFGGSYTFDWSSTRFSSNNFFNALNPATSSRFSLSYTQPLARGRSTDDSRRQSEIAKKNLTLTDVQFRQRATEVITRVEHGLLGIGPSGGHGGPPLQKHPHSKISRGAIVGVALRGHPS